MFLWIMVETWKGNVKDIHGKLAILATWKDKMLKIVISKLQVANTKASSWQILKIEKVSL